MANEGRGYPNWKAATRPPEPVRAAFPRPSAQTAGAEKPSFLASHIKGAHRGGEHGHDDAGHGEHTHPEIVARLDEHAKVLHDVVAEKMPLPSPGANVHRPGPVLPPHRSLPDWEGAVERAQLGAHPGETPSEAASRTGSPEARTATAEARKDYSHAERVALAAKGWALPNLSYPIADKEDLGNAVTLAKSGHGDVTAARALIRKRAKELGLPDPFAEDKGDDRDAVDDLTGPDGDMTQTGPSTVKIGRQRIAAEQDEDKTKQNLGVKV